MIQRIIRQFILIAVWILVSIILTHVFIHQVSTFYNLLNASVLLFIFLGSIRHLRSARWEVFALLSSGFGGGLSGDTDGRPSPAVAWLNLRLARFAGDVDLVQAL